MALNMTEQIDTARDNIIRLKVPEAQRDEEVLAACRQLDKYRLNTIAAQIKETGKSARVLLGLDAPEAEVVIDQPLTREEQIAKVKAFYEVQDENGKTVMIGLQSLSMIPNVVFPAYYQQEHEAKRFLQENKGKLNQDWREIVEIFLRDARNNFAGLEKTRIEGDSIIRPDNTLIYEGSDPVGIKKIMQDHIQRGIDLMKALKLIYKKKQG